MSSRVADVERLNHAITSLNEDAEGMHELITRSVNELENATAASNRAADNAAKIIEALEPMAKEMEARYRDSAEMLGEAKKASDEQRAATAEQMEAMKGAVTVSLEYVGTSAEAASDGLKKSVEDSMSEIGKAQDRAFGELTAKIIEALEPMAKEMEARYRDSTAMLGEAKRASDEQRAATAEQMEAMKGAVEEALKSVGSTTKATRDELGKAQKEAFDDIRMKNLKEHERTRDELQTDILGFKNATSVRLDALETELAKAQGVIDELEGKVSESTVAASKRLLIPIYVAIGLGIVNLICLAMLLMR